MTPGDALHCFDVEILLAEYVDGTLTGEARRVVESHLNSCAGCRELAQDAASAVEFLGRTAAIEPPPELVTRILFQVPSLKPSLARRLFGRVLGAWLEPCSNRAWRWVWAPRRYPSSCCSRRCAS